jgi:Uma2 family endonuclease
MALAASHHDLTADEYFALADRLPRFTQLIDGEVIVNSPNSRHQDAVGELYYRLRLWIAERPGRGWCGFQLDAKVNERNVYQPDLWWCSETNRLESDALRHMSPPDLVVEVLSPSTRRYDLGIKRQRYEEQGFPELWIIDPKRPSATILRCAAPASRAFDLELALGPHDELTSPQLPGFAVRVGDLIL